MSVSEPQRARRKGLGRGLTAALLAASGIGVAGVLYVIVSALARPGAEAGMSGLSHGAMAKLQVLPNPVAAAPVLFVDQNTKPVRLTDFKGHPVVLNLWATWCAPCVKEMPTLAALQAGYAAQGVKVVAVSMDQSAQTPQAKAFIAKHAPLNFYQDAKFAFMTDLTPHPLGFPTTLLIDRHGMERAVYSGDTDWSGPDARAVVDKLIAQ